MPHDMGHSLVANSLVISQYDHERKSPHEMTRLEELKVACVVTVTAIVSVYVNVQNLFGLYGVNFDSKSPDQVFSSTRQTDLSFLRKGETS
ncbi:hypothetical protein AVEN_194417-1 [Araneus ventricosus]|uniref:Uncharacterized protein n=1 Tax=Araneus ventricosus TaxID=182803 RepID=A0A4Y2A5W3_ARAVE|nr:hypothetical protein AVEN_194417-1 [Araneus ventricosus]